MAEDRFGNSPDNQRTRYEVDPIDPSRLNADDSDFSRSNASVGWLVGAVVLLGILVYAFEWKVDDRSAETSSTPITTGQANSPGVRPVPTPSPVSPAPSATPASPSTTGSSPNR